MCADEGSGTSCRWQTDASGDVCKACMKELCCIQKAGMIRAVSRSVLVACLQGVSVSECGL